MQVIYSIANRAIASDWLTEFKDQFFDLSLKQLLPLDCDHFQNYIRLARTITHISY
jgi:hypothetical protein